MRTIKHILPWLAALALLCGCERHTEVFFDTPFDLTRDLLIFKKYPLTHQSFAPFI